MSHTDTPLQGSAKEAAPSVLGALDSSEGPALTEPKLRSLLVISMQPPTGMRERVAAGIEPRRDYDALRAALDADAVFPDDALSTRFGRLLTRFLGGRLAVAWEAFRRRRQYDVLYSDAELVSLPLGLLLKLGSLLGGRPRHVALAHRLSPLKKRLLVSLGAGGGIDTLIVHSTAQYDLARQLFGHGRTRVVKLPYFVDTRFWKPGPGTSLRPSTVPARPLICSTGQECRDFGTLIRAVDGLEADVRITAGSAPMIAGASAQTQRRSARQAASLAALADLPDNLVIGRCKDYAELRQLYASSRFVIVPLQPVDFQAGVTVVLEAMSMGKAVIVSATPGQTDVVRERPQSGDQPERELPPGFVDPPYAELELGGLATGIYVAPGEPDDLRRATQYLLDHPEVADELGRNGRRVAESVFTLEHFAQRFAAAIRGEPSPERPRALVLQQAEGHA